MKEIILDTLFDVLKLLPFLFITFLIMEYVEHKFSKKSKSKITKAGKYGPILGSLLGAVPQCGFSVMATNLYATRIITVGTLISIYLSTSDEMLPILISEKAPVDIILKIILVKVIIGMISGFVIDLILSKKKNKRTYEIKDFCLETHCDCDHGIIRSSIKHTVSILLFIMGISFVLNLGIEYLGEDKIAKLFLKDNLFSPFLSGIVGLIPNCGASVVLTELYLKNVISLSSCVSGLLTGSGVALLVLFKVNKKIKDNIKILITIYLIGSLFGVLVNVIKMIF